MTLRFSLWTSLLSGCLFFTSAVNAATTSVAPEGYLLKDLKSGKILAEKESTHYFTPASNLKIFTAATALMVLGPDFTYKTQLFFNPQAIHQQTLTGDVTLVFSGDPMLKQQDLEALLKSLKSHGIHRIHGNIYFVMNALDNRPYADGWPWDQLHICYSGPVNTLNLDQNCFLFHVFPTKNNHPLDVPPSVQCSQRAQGEPCVINQAMTGDGPNCQLLFDHHDNQYTLSGCLSSHKRSERMRVAIPNASLYAQVLVKQQLKNLGVILDGHMLIRGEKPTGTAMETHESLPLHLLIRVMMKYSDDLIANALFKTTGGIYYHAQGTWQRGINAEKEVLGKALGLPPESMFIFDGSGESYYNAITPEQMMRLLVYIQKTPALAKVIIPSLPVNGADGTMVNRLRNYPSVIHAKTGTWRDVAALSGYVIKYNTLWAFSIFVNGMTPIERGDATQVDAWMMSVLPPVTHTTKVSSKKIAGKTK